MNQEKLEDSIKDIKHENKMRSNSAYLFENSGIFEKIEEVEAEWNKICLHYDWDVSFKHILDVYLEDKQNSLVVNGKDN